MAGATHSATSAVIRLRPWTTWGRRNELAPEAERAVRAVVAPAFEAALSHNGELLERFLKVLSALGAAG